MNTLSMARGYDTLSQVGLFGGIPDPHLRLWELPASGGWQVVAENDDWENHPRAQEIDGHTDTPSPSTARDSAVLQTLESGIFTYMVEDVAGNSGLVLHDLLTLGSTSRSVIMWLI